MDKEKIQQFFDEFIALQEKYGVRLYQDCEEVIDYNWDEEPYVSGVTTYMTLYNSDGTKELAAIDYVNSLIIKE